MRYMNVQMDQIRLLIDRIQSQFIYTTPLNRTYYDKLLALSEQLNYSYGQALAHIYLAQYYLIMLEEKAYEFHLNKAAGIAQRKSYFDVLVGYYRLEGLHSTSICSEMTALSMYLNGILMADKIQDRKSGGIFYHLIGELFFQNGAYEEAEQFNRKALEEIEKIKVKHSDGYKKIVLVSLLRISGVKGELAKAKEYSAKCAEVHCDGGNLRLLLIVEEIRILLLELRERDASNELNELKNMLLREKQNAFLLQPIYCYFMELALVLGEQALATWCLDKMEGLFTKTPQSMAIQAAKLRIQYAEAFHIEDDGLYEAFYKATQKGAFMDRRSTAESLKNLIALHEAGKEQVRIQEEQWGLQTVANIDDLTKIYNRRYLSKLVSKFLQDEHTKALGCIMMDVDFFKEYNDFYGHTKGDRVLTEIAAALLNNLPPQGYAARYGGDEFICLFLNSSTAQMIQFVKAVQGELREKNIPHEKNKGPQAITLSFGIYHETDREGWNESRLVEKADEVLYQAKKEGRNTYAIST